MSGPSGASGVAVAVATTSPAAAFAVPVQSSPGISEPPAKRPKRMAAISASQRMQKGARRQDQRSPLPPPEQAREVQGDETTDCNTSVGDAQDRIEEPISPPPLPSPPLELPDNTQARGAVDVHTLDRTLDEKDDENGDNRESPASPPLLLSPPPKVKECDCTSDCEEEDFHTEEWEDGCRLNTIKPPWVTVFPKRRGKCRFCMVLLPLSQEGKGECDDCVDLSTFQLVKKHAPRWRYPKY